MDTFLYKCQYCGKEYKPNRRYKQKFCSASCRANSFNRNKKPKLALMPNKEINTKPLQIEKMSWSGAGNAAAGTLAVNLATKLFTSQENKPATKGDLKNLLTTLKQRHQPIKGIPLRSDGAKPFYDMQTQTIVYLDNSMNYGTK